MRAQRGAATVEFAIVGLLFFVLIFAVLELGRLMFSWNTLEEAARRGARVAVVCPPNHSAIAQVAVFNDGGNPADSPVLSGLTTSNIAVDYLDSSGNAVSPTLNYSLISYVRVKIVNFQYQWLIPGYPLTFTMPSFATVLPRESLGVSPTSVECFGTPT